MTYSALRNRMLPERFENDLLRSYPAGDIRRVLLSDEELATGSRLEIGRNFLGDRPSASAAAR